MKGQIFARERQSVFFYRFRRILDKSFLQKRGIRCIIITANVTT